MACSSLLPAEIALFEVLWFYHSRGGSLRRMRRFEFVPKNFPKPQDDDGEIGGAITTCLEIPMKLPIEGPLDGCVQSEKTEGAVSYKSYR